jgi:hypothetical protein
LKDAYPVWAGGRWKRTRHSGHLASGLPVLQVSRANAQDTPVRLWVVSDKMQVVVLVWDASPLPPVLVDASEDAETGRGLLLVQALSTRWGWHFPPGLGGKVVWAQTVLE